MEKQINKTKTKIEIGDKVILRDDIAFKIPYPLHKGSVLSVNLVEGNNARVGYGTINFNVPLEFLLKTGEERTEKEEVRVVRKLKDLEG